MDHCAGTCFVRCSAHARRLHLQRDALLAAGVDGRHLFEDRVSGSRGDRAGLARALAFLRPGDYLVVCKLDRLGRSLPHLLTTVTDLKARGIASRSLTEQMDTTTPQGEFLFTFLARWRSSSGRSRTVTASLIMRQLATYPRQNGVAAALRELGRLVRTSFTLDWISDPELRRATGQELNKGNPVTAWRAQSSSIGWVKSATAPTKTSNILPPASTSSSPR